MAFQRCVSLVLVLLATIACGYRFVDERAVFGGEVSSIQILAFENRSTEVGYEQMLADTISEEFARRGALRPVYGSRGADLILLGMIRDVRVRSRSFSSVELSVEDSVEVSLDVRVARRATQESVWELEQYRVDELFLASPDPQVYESNKEQALRRLSALIAERIHDGLFQNF